MASKDRVNLLSPEVRKDPYPTYAQLRRDSPVCQVEPMGFWAVSRYEDVEFVLKNPDLFSSAGFGALLRPDWLPHNPLSDSLLARDGRDHARLRGLVSRAFTPRAISRLEPLIRGIAATLCDRLQAVGETDVVRDLCSPLTGSVIAEILGIDPSLHQKFKQWSGHLEMVTPVYPGDDLAAAIRTTIAEMEGYFREVVAARRLHAEDDTVSDLIRAEVEGAALTDEEIISFLFLLLPAGFESTAHLLSVMMLGFTERPDEYTRLRMDRTLIADYVEETLRKESPIHGVLRLTTAEAEIGGATIPPGSMVLVLVASANQDESQFPDPERFDPSRNQIGAAFGRGAHFCLGASLARVEGRIVLEELVSRFRGFERLPGTLQWNVSLPVRGLIALPLRCLPCDGS